MRFCGVIRVLVSSALGLGLFEVGANLALAQVSAASPQTAQLTVTVTDPAGAVIPNAEVTVKGQESLSSKTSAYGTAQALLPFGTYDIAITSRGFKRAKIVHYTIDKAQPLNLTVALQLGSNDDHFPSDPGAGTIASELPSVLLSSPRVQNFPSASFSYRVGSCPKNQPKTESALIELEHHWADALTHKDAVAVACILADEFEDADVDGSVHSRAEALAKIPQRKPWTNRLTEMRAHVEGNSGFARGLNEVLDADGKVVARVRFTDIFTYRDGRWQALAGHETLVGEAHR